MLLCLPGIVVLWFNARLRFLRWVVGLFDMTGWCLQGLSVSERASGGGCALLFPLQVPSHLLLGALARAALPADEWGRTGAGWSLRQGGVMAGGGGGSVTWMLCWEGTEDGQGSFATSCPSVSSRLAVDMATDTYTCFGVAALLCSVSERSRSSAETLQRHYCLWFCGSQLMLFSSPDISVSPSCSALLQSLSSYFYSWPQLLAFESSVHPKNLLYLLPAAHLSASQIQPFSLSRLSTIHYLSSLGPRNLV